MIARYKGVFAGDGLGHAKQLEKRRPRHKAGLASPREMGAIGSNLDDVRIRVNPPASDNVGGDGSGKTAGRTAYGIDDLLNFE